MKVLVTGSAGHLGEALVRTLKNQDHGVIGIDLIDSDFTDEVGTITNQEFVKKCMEGIDTVFHAATLHKPHVAKHRRQDFIDTNITGTLNLLEEAVSEYFEQSDLSPFMTMTYQVRSEKRGLIPAPTHVDRPSRAFRPDSIGTPPRTPRQARKTTRRNPLRQQ